MESPEEISEAFGGALGAQQSLFAKDLEVTVRSNIPGGEGCKLTSVYAGLYSSSVAAGGESGTVKFANLGQGEKRDFLLTMSLPEALSTVPSPHDLQLVDVVVRYRLVGTVSDALSVAEGHASVHRALGHTDCTPANTDPKVTEMVRTHVFSESDVNSMHDGVSDEENSKDLDDLRKKFEHDDAHTS